MSSTAIPSDVKPYTINVPESAITALKSKLSNAVFPDELDEAAWDYGSPLADVKRLTAYWRDEFDWKKAEAKLNQFPQYKTPVAVEGFGEVGVHFLWARSGKEGALPLLFVHGWPGNFLEATKIFPMLQKSGRGGDDGPVFDIVVPSLPNYAFSDGTKKKGFGIKKYAETFNNLMHKLGYKEYVTQGGDWGGIITRCMGLLYPQYVKASHLNFPLCGPPTFSQNPLVALSHSVTPYSERDKAALARTAWFRQSGSGYFLEQSTKPQTIGYALQDSPVALLAWIYEKLHDWTDSYPWTPDEVCTWISLYWFSTAGPAANVRIYYEMAADPVTGGKLRQWIPSVKLGIAHFPKELLVVPLSWTKTMGPVVYESMHDSGGHFAAWEKPDAIVKDLKAMFGKGGPAFGVVKGKEGY